MEQAVYGKGSSRAGSGVIAGEIPNHMLCYRKAFRWWAGRPNLSPPGRWDKTFLRKKILQSSKLAFLEWEWDVADSTAKVKFICFVSRMKIVHLKPKVNPTIATTEDWDTCASTKVAMLKK
jgi:hypothetical protein